MTNIEALIAQSKPDANGRSRNMQPTGSGVVMWIAAPHKGKRTIHIDGDSFTMFIRLTADEMIALGAALIAHGRDLPTELPLGVATEDNLQFPKP